MTEEEIKAKYGEDVSKIEIFISESDIAVGYVKPVTRYIASPIIAKIINDPVGACEIWLDACLIDEISDKRIKSDDTVFLSAMSNMNSVIELKKSKLTHI